MHASQHNSLITMTMKGRIKSGSMNMGKRRTGRIVSAAVDDADGASGDALLEGAASVDGS